MKFAVIDIKMPTPLECLHQLTRINEGRSKDYPWFALRDNATPGRVVLSIAPDFGYKFKPDAISAFRELATKYINRVPPHIRDALSNQERILGNAGQLFVTSESLFRLILPPTMADEAENMLSSIVTSGFLEPSETED